MAESEGVFARMKKARFQTAANVGEVVSQERMAELVSAQLGRVLHPTQWRRYETDREPPLEVIVATARVSGLSETFIAFGTRSRGSTEAEPELPGGAQLEKAQPVPRSGAAKKKLG
jgi:hypothetical protein